MFFYFNMMCLLLYLLLCVVVVDVVSFFIVVQLEANKSREKTLKVTSRDSHGAGGTEESQLCKNDSPLEEDQIYLSHALRSLNAHTPHADTQACRPRIHAHQRNALPLTAAPRSIWIRMICWNL